MTLFQFLEGLADDQAAEATRVRIDWKYALHLPLGFPGLRASSLCNFRRRLLDHEWAKAVFHQVLNRVEEKDGLGHSPSVDPDEVLRAVCVRSRLEVVASAMRSAVHTLVATQDEWLRGIVPLHWYQRYPGELSMLQAPGDLESQVKLAESIGRDGAYLLRAIAEVNSPDLAGPEVQTLKQVWNRPFEWQEGSCKWRRPDCARCIE